MTLTQYVALGERMFGALVEPASLPNTEDDPDAGDFATDEEFRRDDPRWPQ